MKCVVYFVRTKNNANLIKIGLSSNIEKRMQTFRTGNPTPIELMGTIECESRKHAQGVESNLHRTFRHWRTTGEWFSPGKPLRDFIAYVSAGGHVETGIHLVKTSEAYKNKVRSMKNRQAVFEKRKNDIRRRKN